RRPPPLRRCRPAARRRAARPLPRPRLRRVLRALGRRGPPRAHRAREPPAAARRTARRRLDRARLPSRPGGRHAALQLRRRARGRAGHPLRPDCPPRPRRARHPPRRLPRPDGGLTMPVVVISAYEVARFERATGHFWVYAQYVDGLRANGCEIWWLERLPPARAHERAERLADRLAPFGLAN